MIDIHSHVLWDLDDGPEALEESVEMLRAASSSGTTDIVATPHMNAEFAFRPELRDEKIQALAALAAGSPRIHKGCEFHLSVDNLDPLLEDPTAYTINNRQYLLMECPDHHVGKHAETVVRRLVDSGIIPIVAHPERNPVLQRDPARLEAWIESGCLAQLTTLSITGHFGQTAASVSARLLERGLAHVVASDAHDSKFRHTCMDKAFELVQARYGEDTAEILFQDNPQCVIEGNPIAGGRQTFQETSTTKWWQFWKSGPDSA